MKPVNIVSSKMLAQIIETADNCRNAGATVEINEYLPTVAITRSDGQEWFFQEHEADVLLAEVPDNVSADDYILFISRGW